MVPLGPFVLLPVAWFHFVLCLCCSLLCVCMYLVFLIHTCCDGPLGVSLVSAIVKSATMIIGVHVSLWMILLSEYMPRNGTARYYGNSLCTFFVEPMVFFHRGFTNLHSHQQCRRVSFVPHLLMSLLFHAFLLMATLACMNIFTWIFDLHFCNHQ